MLWQSLPDALRKLDPRTLWRNPVMFIVEIGAVWSTDPGDHRPVLVRLADRRLAVADGRSSPTWPRPSPRAAARRRPSRCARPRPTPWRAGSSAGRPARPAAKKRSPRRCCSRATSSWSRPARSSPATATSWKALPRWTSRRSPVSRHPSSANPAATVRRSPAAPPCSRTASSSRSPRSRVRASSTG